MRACKINRRENEIIAWSSKGNRYALVKRDGKIFDQSGREIDRSLTAKAAIEAAMA